MTRRAPSACPQSHLQWIISRLPAACYPPVCLHHCMSAFKSSLTPTLNPTTHSLTTMPSAPLEEHIILLLTHSSVQYLNIVYWKDE